MSRKTAVIMGFALAIAMSILGCKGIGEDRPSEAEGKAAILDQIKNLPETENGGAIKLVGFRKTDGQAIEVFGAKGYRMEYECEIEFTRDCNYTGNGFTSLRLYDMSLNVKSGERRKVTGYVEFEKTENGWRVSSR
jgi:hypothetical protein